MKKFFALFMILCTVLLCACSDSKTSVKKSSEEVETKKDIMEIIEGYWYCQEGYDGSEFVAIKDKKYARGCYSYTEDWADIKNVEEDEDELNFELVYSKADHTYGPYPYSESEDSYSITLKSDNEFEESFELDDGIGKYTFVRKGKDRCDFMLNVSKDLEDMPQGIAVAYAPEDYEEQRDKFTYVSNEDGDYAKKVVIYTDGSIKDFEFIRFGYAGSYPCVGEVLYSEKKLSKDKHIVTGIVFLEFTSSTGMRFKDAKGKKWVCNFMESGRNGSVSFHPADVMEEYDPGNKKNEYRYEDICAYWVNGYEFVNLQEDYFTWAYLGSDVGRSGDINCIYTDNKGAFVLDVTLEEYEYGYEVVPESNIFVEITSPDKYKNSIDLNGYDRYNSYTYCGDLDDFEDYRKQYTY